MSGKHSLNDNDLNIPFANKERLAEHGTPFMLRAYAERTTKFKGEDKEESVFTIFLVDGPERGYDQLLTFTATAARRRLGQMLSKRSPRGPVTIVLVTKNKEGKKLANPRYEFVPVTDNKTIAQADALVEQLERGALVLDDEEEEADDLPF